LIARSVKVGSLWEYVLSKQAGSLAGRAAVPHWPHPCRKQFFSVDEEVDTISPYIGWHQGWCSDRKEVSMAGHIPAQSRLGFSA